MLPCCVCLCVRAVGVSGATLWQAGPSSTQLVAAAHLQHDGTVRRYALHLIKLAQSADKTCLIIVCTVTAPAGQLCCLCAADMSLLFILSPPALVVFDATYKQAMSPHVLLLPAAAGLYGVIWTAAGLSLLKRLR